MHAFNSAEQSIEPVKGHTNRYLLLISSNLLKLFVQLAVIYIYSRLLSLTDYALYQSVWMYVNVAAIICLFGLPNLILSASFRQVREWIIANRTTFFIVAALANLVPFIFIFYTAIHFDFTTKMLLVALIVVQNVSVIGEALAVKAKKEKLLLITNSIFSAGYLAVHIAITVDYSLSYLLILLIILTAAKCIILWIFNRERTESDNETPDLGKQWLYLGLFDITGVIFKWLDKSIIFLFISVAHFAIYFNGSYEIPVFALLVSAVGNIMVVEISSRKDILHIREMFRHSTLFLGSLVFPSVAFLIYYHYDFFILLFSEKYAAAIPVFMISIFVLPVRITSFTAVLQAYHRNDIVLRGALIDLCAAIILMIILYPLMDLPGIALAFVISTYIQAAFYLWQTGRLVEQPGITLLPFGRLLGMFIFSTGIMRITYHFSKELPDHWPMIAGFIVGAVMAVVMLLVFFGKRKDRR